MEQAAKARWEQIFAWCGPVFVVSFVFFWGWVGHNIPPPGPGMSATQIAAHYAENNTSIRIGFIMSVLCVGFYLPWSVLLTVQLARREGSFPILSILQLVGGTLTMFVVSTSGYF